MASTPQPQRDDEELAAGGGRADRCGRIRGKKACWAAGCVRSHHRCVKPRFAPGQIVKVHGEYCKVVRALPNNRYQVQSLQRMHRQFRARGQSLAPGTVAHSRSVVVLPSGRVVPRAALRPLFRLSSTETVYTHNGEPILLRHGSVDRHASRSTILDLLERLAAGLARAGPAARGRPQCDPFQWNSDQMCRDRGYPGGCGSNKHPTHCNPGGESGGSAAQRAVRRYRQQQKRQHSQGRSPCKARCRAWPENTKQQRKEKHACFVSCKER